MAILNTAYSAYVVLRAILVCKRLTQTNRQLQKSDDEAGMTDGRVTKMNVDVVHMPHSQKVYIDKHIKCHIGGWARDNAFVLCW
jgi:hypothetical protein